MDETLLEQVKSNQVQADKAQALQQRQQDGSEERIQKKLFIKQKHYRDPNQVE